MGNPIIVTTTASDSDADTSADQVKLFVCKAADATSSGCGAGGTWCSTGLVASNPSCNFLIPAGYGTKTYYVYIFDNHNLGALANPVSTSFTIDISRFFFLFE